MARQILAIISPNPDINQLRDDALELMQTLGKKASPATREDIHWFWEDQGMDLEMDKDLAWDYVNSNFEALDKQYPFDVTEWFMEFHRYMPDCLKFHWDRAGLIDWNLFMSLAKPLPTLNTTSFKMMITKLNVAQQRREKEKIKTMCWKDPTLRDKLVKGEIIPAKLTELIPYQSLRKTVVDRLQEELRPKFEEMLKLQKQGVEIELVTPRGARNGKTPLDAR